MSQGCATSAELVVGVLLTEVSNPFGFFGGRRASNRLARRETPRLAKLQRNQQLQTTHNQTCQQRFGTLLTGLISRVLITRAE
jgi:hypothetical protein